MMMSPFNPERVHIMNINQYFGIGSYNGLWYYKGHVGADYAPDTRIQSGKPTNAIDEILSEGKRDKVYYLAKYIKIFDELNKKAYHMYKNGELSMKEYERFHSDCLYLRGNYQYRYNHCA